VVAEILPLDSLKNMYTNSMKRKKVSRKSSSPTFTISTNQIVIAALMIATAAFIAYNLGAAATVQKVNKVLQEKTSSAGSTMPY
jgi:hypothetical protein